MSAAEALPPVTDNPWRDTSHILDLIPTDADLAAAPPPNLAGRAVHDANVAKLTTQAAWQVPGVDGEDDLLDALYQAHVDQAFLEHAETVRDWPASEPTEWN